MKSKVIVTGLLMSLFSIATTAQKREISMEDLKASYKFQGKYIAPTVSLADGEHYATMSEKTIKIFAYKTGKEEGTIMDLDKIKDCPIESFDGYEFSANEQKILIYNNTHKIYRHSFTADYYVYDIHYNELKPISEGGQERNAIISPDGTMVAYVKNNNIYVKKFRYDTTSTITTDGKINEIINGAPDWVYEEEFAMLNAMAWSADSKEIAYIRFDESQVKEYSFPLYQASYPQYDEYATYPGEYSYKYPKAGEKNSIVSVNVYNLDSKKTKTMDIGSDKQQYIPRICWTATPGQLAIYRLNRRQDKLDVLLANTASTVCKEMFTDKNQYYVDESVLDNSMFLPDGQTFIYVGELDGRNHIHVYGTNGVKKAQLTKGDWDVTSLLGYDDKTKTLFYEAARTSPMNRDIYSITLDGKIEKRLSKGDGTSTAVMSANCKYYQLTYSDVNTPRIYTINEAATGKVLRTIEDNMALRKRLNDEYVFHSKEFFSFTTAEGIKLNGWMVKPSNFDENKKYPVLMYQYSGPNSQEVLNRWSLDWEQVLAGEGYIMVCVDGRGTGCRGEEFKKCTYRRLGRLESDDQIATANYLGGLPYVDEQRIGIWGWSFGGFMTSLCLCRSDLFKMGIAVAPVTNWRYYDSIYTERFMRTPEENSSGYDSNSPVGLAENLHGRLFLIHGTADDNVHYQNQMEFVDALIRNGKQFDMFTYPNKNHSIYGGSTRLHLYTMMLNYVKNNL
ncbi:MAG: DPP IV N-terminal domain-containing protein [Bacteroidales bacterium]|nr:DPP IV N-terminal domain-containing protein [Bacteroidales bacterium]